ncbi:MAG: hypothetical protein PHQ58_02375 [Rhodoferax sp.]|uniref:hypothetical protein n=1 Tax=Rhodoferax sp. TaxID=50421 RepID=UPI00260D37C6|nr:hypothetical protein [Rhodoferax sp.]MDD2879257.1 hypothetical protein [Rhodoferax sp.]
MKTPEGFAAEVRIEIAHHFPDLYSHPDGYEICYDRFNAKLCVSLDEFNDVGVPIGTDGLIELGLKMIALGHEINTARALKEVA